MTTTDDMTAKLRALEARNAELENEMGERVDPADFMLVIQMVADAEDSIEVFLETSLYKDLLHATQSNPERTDGMVREWVKRDAEISALDDAITELTSNE